MYFIKSAQSSWLANSLHITLLTEDLEFRAESPRPVNM